MEIPGRLGPFKTSNFFHLDLSRCFAAVPDESHIFLVVLHQLLAFFSESNQNVGENLALEVDKKPRLFKIIATSNFWMIQIPKAWKKYTPLKTNTWHWSSITHI